MNSIETDKGSSLWKDAWIKLSKNRLALVGLGLLSHPDSDLCLLH